MGEGDKQSPGRLEKPGNAKTPVTREPPERLRPPKQAAEPADPVSRDRRHLASGTLPVQNAPLLSRTSTLDDPLTTSLLAEISRRSRTIDVSPDQIAAVEAIAAADAYLAVGDLPQGEGDGDPFAELQAEFDREAAAEFDREAAAAAAKAPPAPHRPRR
jgi:hypothetical protein